ncbi:MAG TPA: AAA family ATPase [Gaiellaceae bacterium]|nr:AAA family ATPase [Gaiellaceae bacterium]
MPSPRYPTADGLHEALKLLDESPAPRLFSTVPVLLAVEAALQAGQGVTINGTEAVPNPRIFKWLDEWFDLSGNGKDYYVPFPLPGATSRHRRGESILAQATMSTAIRRDWVDNAKRVPGEKRSWAYPLLDLPGWRDAVAEELNRPELHGLDLALLSIWLGRTSGIPAVGATPTRQELVAFALERLGLPTDGSHDLCQTSPPILSADGDDTWDATHFGSVPLSLDEVAEVCEGVDPQATPIGDGGSITAVTISHAALELDEYVRRMLRISIASSKAVMLVGPPGTGKTELAFEVEQAMKDGKGAAFGITKPPDGVMTVTPDDEWSSTTLIGGITLDENGKLTFRPGYVLQAIAANSWLLLDEANRGDLDKIFGGLLTWLAGRRVQVGMTSTAHDAQQIYLEWSDDEACSVDGLEQLEPGAKVTKPVRFIAGKNWRFIGTFNPVDAQRVFKLGQALGRRFRRVPVPPPQFNRFETLLAQRAASLEPSVRAAIVQIYRVHEDFEPPLGPAPFLDLCEYLLTAGPISGNGSSEDQSTELEPDDGEGVTGEVGETTTEEPAELSGVEATEDAAEVEAPGEVVESEAAEEDAGGAEAQPVEEDLTEGPRLPAAISRLVAEAYVASLGTWLAQLTPAERSKMRSRLVPDVFSSSDWAWLERMFRSL